LAAPSVEMLRFYEALFWERSEVISEWEKSSKSL
jgi:hypothetical protein